MLRRNKAVASILTGIVLTAIGYIGYKEKPNNSGFQNPTFEKAMIEYAGWHKYDSWCVDFAKLCWYMAPMPKPMHDRAMQLIVGNSQSTLNNFRKDTSGYFVLSDSAKTGYIVIWQEYNNGKGLWSGHAGIVIKDSTNCFVTVEGNTNDYGGREGYIVAKKIRKYNFNVTNGLRLKKFIGINSNKL